MYGALHETLRSKGHYSNLRLRERMEEHLDAYHCRGLDGYSFFGVFALESEPNSVYHAVPPPGIVAYQYHLIQPKREDVIRVREERVRNEG